MWCRPRQHCSIFRKEGSCAREERRVWTLTCKISMSFDCTILSCQAKFSCQAICNMITAPTSGVKMGIGRREAIETSKNIFFGFFLHFACQPCNTLQSTDFSNIQPSCQDKLKKSCYTDGSTMSYLFVLGSRTVFFQVHERKLKETNCYGASRLKR